MFPVHPVHPRKKASVEDRDLQAEQSLNADHQLQKHDAVKDVLMARDEIKRLEIVRHM